MKKTKKYSIIIAVIFILFILQLIIILKINYKLSSDNLMLATGRYYIEKTNADYNILKKENDLYQCLNNNYLFYYNIIWNQYCEDLELEDDCALPGNLQKNIKEFHQQRESECYLSSPIISD